MSSVVPRRRCDYKGCTEFRDKFNLNQNVKFFSFPSDLERKKKWLELSQTESQNPKFICSKHFADIYLSYSQRRVHLVTSALPIDYNTVNSIYVNVENSNNVQQDEHKEEKNTVDEFIDNTLCFAEVESTPINYNEEKPIENNQPQTKILNSLVPISFKERKIEISPISTESKKAVNSKKIKLVKLDNTKIKRFYKANTLIKQESRDKNTIIEIQNVNTDKHSENGMNKKTEKVRTVLLDGEEYIQMPKSLYIKERMDLLNQIENYKSILKDFKYKLEDLSFI
ncbi:uncharacterized protein LOC129608774 [Condylostylus longicornis]|uniref:uncharacterized protein LOC129608774 n=1 Tax=Condylostylus longicornis TaxID=2530218 RepID=UPI00244E0FC4|nr:uncharacterized protein LOC129608774 [Condylostylus longicornis]